jgi:hypothetical protein
MIELDDAGWSWFCAEQGTSINPNGISIVFNQISDVSRVVSHQLDPKTKMCLFERKLTLRTDK